MRCVAVFRPWWIRRSTLRGDWDDPQLPPWVNVSSLFWREMDALHTLDDLRGGW